jgi:rubrerythrin
MTGTLYDDELVFLAHSVALEQEAAERLYELAETMEVHNNRALHQLLTELAGYSESHAAEIGNMCQGKTLPSLQAWEYSWPEEESPEVFLYANVHYLMSVEQALLVALEVEQNAEAFYKDVAQRSGDTHIQEMALQFAQEEYEHVKAVSLRMDSIQAATHKGATSALDQTDFDPPHMPE